MARKKRVPQPVGSRNHLHNHPLLKKGGIHEQSTKAKRQQDKVKLKREWSQVNNRFFYLWLLRLSANQSWKHSEDAQVLPATTSCQTQLPAQSSA